MRDFASERRVLQLNWSETRDGFFAFLRSRQLSMRYIRDKVSYLDRYLSIVTAPEDLIEVFADLSNGQRAHLQKGIRLWLKYCNLIGLIDEETLFRFLKVLPQNRDGIDIKIPREDKIIEDLKRINEIPLKYALIFNIIIDSGLRLIEAVRCLGKLREAEKINEGYRLTIGFFRGSKQSYYAYLTEYTVKRGDINGEEINDNAASSYFRKHHFTPPKYLRKFVYDRMLALGVPESVADFIQGRVPQRVGARHYTQLMRQADLHYPKYAEYLNELRRRAGVYG